MNGLLQDLRYAFRQLRKSPGVTFSAAVMLALGMGVNTAIFAVSYQVLLKTLPVRKPAELVLLKEISKFETGHLDIWGGKAQLSFAYPAYQALREGNQSLEDLAVSTIAPATIVSSQTTDKSLAQHVTGNYFALLGVQPVLGRLLVPDDDISNAGRDVAVLSESYWRSHFGSDPSILNQRIEINGSPFTIVGVARHEGLMDAARPAVFVPVNFQRGPSTARQNFLDPLHRWLNIIGRLRPAVSREQAEAQLNTVWWNWRRDVLKEKKDNIPDKEGWLQTHLYLTSGARGIPLLQGTLGEPLTVLEALALLVLIIACANVASLLMAKAVVRTRELAIHAALGGSRRRILQKVVSESVLLGIIGVCLGLLLGSLTLKFLVSIVPSRADLPTISIAAQLGWSTIAFCVSGGMLTCLLFSLAPAVLSSRINVLNALHPQADSAPGNAARLRNLLVAGEIALSLVSLTGAAVFGWSLHQLRNVSPGYNTSVQILTFRVDASMLGKSDAQIKNEYAEITEAIRRQPGVRNVSYAAEGLLGNSEMGSNITVAGYSDQGNEPTLDENWVTPSLFSTLNIPLLIGRAFSEQDMATSQKVAIVDEAFVKHYFGGNVEKALGARFGFGGGDRVKLDIEIVGVIPTIRATTLAQPPSVPFIYLPYDQTYSPTEPDPRNHPASFYIDTSGDTHSLAATIRALVHSIDRNLPVTRLESMPEHLNAAMFETRMASALSAALGGLGLILAAIGLYGLLAFIVAQRTREIGIRIALGAHREHIAGLIAKRLTAIVSAGVLLGTFLAWGGVHLLASHDINLSRTPIWLFAATTVVLLVVMLAAAALPTRRAAKVDPVVALRYE
jgi:putative ABC transport system permease protein